MLTKSKLDSEFVDGEIVYRCCYCGDDTIAASKIKTGHRPICDECSLTKQPLIVTSMKTSFKRAISSFKKKVQKKRKVSAKKTFASSDEEDWDSGNESSSSEDDMSSIANLKEDDDSLSENYEETNTNASQTEETDQDAIDQSKQSDEDDYLVIGSRIITSNSAKDDDSVEVGSTTNVAEEHWMPSMSSSSDVFARSNLLYLELGLTKAEAPGMGDCLIQASMMAFCNREDELSADEEESLSRMKWSFSNLVANGKTVLPTNLKYKRWRNYRVGQYVERRMHMGGTETDVVCAMMGIKILKVSPCRRANGGSNVHLSIHVPIEGSKVRGKEHTFILCKDYTMHYVVNSRKRIREYIDVAEMIMNEELIVIEFYGLHYDPVILPSIDTRHPVWSRIESHNIFYPTVDTKLCPVCNKLTYTDEPTIQCVLCELWVHCQAGEPCMKYWSDIDIDEIVDNESMHYYCPACVDTLISYQKTTKEKCTVDSLINCLRSFNLEGVDVKEEEEIEILNIVLSKALGN